MATLAEFLMPGNRATPTSKPHLTQLAQLKVSIHQYWPIPNSSFFSITFWEYIFELGQWQILP
jgi:hypothetical protein